MSLRSIAAVVVLSLAPSSAFAQVQQAKVAAPDFARLHDAEWQVVPIVKLDSSQTEDTMAVREIRRVAWLRPGRVFFEGKLTKGGKWAGFSVVDGTLRRLFVSGQDFPGPDGRKAKINLDNGFLTGNGVVGVMAQVDKRYPNTLMVTDGVTWRRIMAQKDTLKLNGAPMLLDLFQLPIVEDSSAVVRASLKEPKVEGYFRIMNGQATSVLVPGDSATGLGVLKPFTAGLLTGMGNDVTSFTLTPTGFVAIVRTDEGSFHYVDHVLVKDGNAVAHEVFRSETYEQHAYNVAAKNIRNMMRTPTGTLLMQYGDSIGFVDAAAWHALLGRDDIKPPKDGNFHLKHVAFIDERSPRAVVSIWLSDTHVSSTASGVSVSYLWSASPQLFYFDGSRLVPVASDSAPKDKSVFWSVTPSEVVRPVPGYEGTLIFHKPFDYFSKSSAKLFDEQARALKPAPAFRTPAGDVGVELLIGWNSEKEAVVRWNGLAFLRGP